MVCLLNWICAEARYGAAHGGSMVIFSGPRPWVTSVPLIMKLPPRSELQMAVSAVCHQAPYQGNIVCHRPCKFAMLPMLALHLAAKGAQLHRRELRRDVDTLHMQVNEYGDVAKTPSGESYLSSRRSVRMHIADRTTIGQVRGQLLIEWSFSVIQSDAKVRGGCMSGKDQGERAHSGGRWRSRSDA